MTKWKAHQNTQITGSVHAQLSTQHKLLVESNRKYMSTLIDIALLLASQGLALRGHNESSNSLNQGKLLQYYYIQLLITLLFIIMLIFKK